MNLDGIKIGVLGGGVSAERDISLISAKGALGALKRNNLEAVFIDINTVQKDKVREILISQEIDVAFIALHGEFGEDGQIQEMLDELNIPYTGSSPKASFQAMDKITAKRIFLKENIPTADFYVWVKKDKYNEEYNRLKTWIGNINYPVVVKPNYSGSSLGVAIVNQEADLESALKGAENFGKGVIIESYISGREFTVGILEDKALGVVEVIPHYGYFDFRSKYSKGLVDFVVPAQLDKHIYENIQQTALGAHCGLGCRHFSRVDIRMDYTNAPYVLEVNSIPGLTPYSLFPRSAQSCGIQFDELILKLALLAYYEKTPVEKN